MRQVSGGVEGARNGDSRVGQSLSGVLSVSLAVTSGLASVHSGMQSTYTVDFP